MNTANLCRPAIRGGSPCEGPTGCRYLDDADRQSSYVLNGWNVTGDRYRLDEDGYFWFEARADDMIVSAGYNIAAPEVEAAMMAHPAVEEVAVVGSPDVERGQIVKAFVVLAPGHVPGPELVRELQDFVKQTAAPYKYPRAIEFLEALPKTATGKLQRFVLRQQELARHENSKPGIAPGTGDFVTAHRTLATAGLAAPERLCQRDRGARHPRVRRRPDRLE